MQFIHESHYFNAGCPKGSPCLKLDWVSLFFFVVFFFMEASNLHINLLIELCSLLEGIYCSDCLQQKRPNQNLLSALISRGRGPSHTYLCDVKSSFDLSFKPGYILLCLRRDVFVHYCGWSGHFRLQPRSRPLKF